VRYKAGMIGAIVFVVLLCGAFVMALFNNLTAAAVLCGAACVVAVGDAAAYRIIRALKKIERNTTPLAAPPVIQQWPTSQPPPQETPSPTSHTESFP
jgi:hypothetical protein